MKYTIKLCTATTPAIEGTVEATPEAMSKLLDELFGTKFSVTVKVADDDM